MSRSNSRMTELIELQASCEIVDKLVGDKDADGDGVESRRRRRRKKLPKPDKHRGYGMESRKR
ncbi:hypothetical protein DVH24_013452 [Malus domestica]|uniref:Uncharacterized protein n=1 Tax=Malus domestica TaxID=3750 RepID=A0A498HGV4_MALDO|nr:hypothetical protein DVH24_013452 [Malus domestica]